MTHEIRLKSFDVHHYAAIGESLRIVVREGSDMAITATGGGAWLRAAFTAVAAVILLLILGDRRRASAGCAVEGFLQSLAVFLACIVLPWGVFCLGLWSIVAEIRFRFGATRIRARVREVSTSRTRRRGRSPSSTVYRPTFEMAGPDGPFEASTRHAASSYGVEVGREMEVLVHPGHPGTVRVPGAFSFVLGGVFVVAGFFFGLIGLALFTAL